MATTQHYMWAGGHFILLISSLRYFLAAILFRAVSAWWYKTAFIGALVSYTIVCEKQYANERERLPPVLSLAFARRVLMEENVQYLLLAIFWWSSKPVAVALIPYAIFSLFHALTFTRTTLMPQLLASGPPATAGGPPTPPALAKKLHLWVKAHYDTAMRVVAYAELLIMLRVTLGALLWQNSLMSPLFYAHFLRQRYYQSKFTRESLSFINDYVEGYVRKEGTPALVVRVWDSFKLVLTRWGGTVLAPQGGAGAGPRGQ
ncbi:hypothetical protein BKA93DRAFT_784378 [Sparassis latifolia]